MKTCLGILALFFLAVAAPAQISRCAICEKPLQGKYFALEDKVDLSRKSVCRDCAELDTWCFICNVPVKEKFTRLADGRYFCERDARDAVLTDEQSRQVCAETREALRLVFGRYLTFPQNNVRHLLVDKVDLEKAFKSPGYNRECGSIFGVTQSRHGVDNNYEHTITLLNGVNRSRLMAVVAHEYAHAWVRENVKETRALSKDAEEGFCEWVAHRVMQERNEQTEMKVITSNIYTRGQIRVFLEGDRQLGPYTIVQWLKQGTDPQVEEANIDRFKMVQAKQSPALVWNVPSAAPARVSDTLVLQGISGPPSKRLALINNCPLLAREEGKVPLGGSNVTIRVLQILEKSVLVSLNGSVEQKELTLAPAAK